MTLTIVVELLFATHVHAIGKNHMKVFRTKELGNLFWTLEIVRQFDSTHLRKPRVLAPLRSLRT